MQKVTLVASKLQIGSDVLASCAQRWDAVGLPPITTGFQSTLSLSNVTLYLSDNIFVSLRSVFGNASHRVKSTGQPTTTTLSTPMDLCALLCQAVHLTRGTVNR
ncbi:Hypothetical protein, putative [Bodo saltans]|uniref:Uncharacterized protein n=1 Tax=Bodo saltans TaxID=75058 RepID=A0A0S4J567_BODSA|nr:Hypothetical protein, putative [Bodo saltans]|eukprot:CUG80587.1 Hypothetical protein, putative [Bodo saltans]